MKKIGILGAGTWGIALARLLFNNGHKVVVWSAIEEEIDVLLKTLRHPHLGNIDIPKNIVFKTNLEFACKNKDIILFAIPSIFVRNITNKVKPYINENQIIVSVSKGLEKDTLYTMTEVINDEVENKNIKLVALSGPTHAEEVILDMPTTIVASCVELEIAEFVQNIFMNSFFRVYTNVDIVGVELCGALKNVIAIATGIAKGLNYGDNAMAGLITRGMVEISRLGMAMGCIEQTFYGLAGIGDLIVTATSKHSRNHQAGYFIGQGFTPQESIKKVGMVVEGVNVLPAATTLAKRYNVEMPIIFSVNDIINNITKASDITKFLMQRSKKTELSKSILDINFENTILKNKRGFTMKRVITYGTFDLLHYGHINLLRRAKALGDYLVVVLSTDEFNWNQKKKKCYFTYEQRKALLESIRYVDLVIPETNWEQKKTDVHEYHIDTFVMGDDWKGKFDFLKDEGVEVVYLPRTPEISTTQIKNDLNRR